MARAEVSLESARARRRRRLDARFPRSARLARGARHRSCAGLRPCVRTLFPARSAVQPVCCSCARCRSVRGRVGTAGPPGSWRRWVPWPTIYPPWPRTPTTNSWKPYSNQGQDRRGGHREGTLELRCCKPCRGVRGGDTFPRSAWGARSCSMAGAGKCAARPGAGRGRVGTAGPPGSWRRWVPWPTIYPPWPRTPTTNSWKPYSNQGQDRRGGHREGTLELRCCKPCRGVRREIALS